MKSVLIIGMGRFGHHLCHKMLELGHEVMVVDEREEVLEDLTQDVTNMKIGDCTNVSVLESLGIRNFDLIFVCIGTNFQSSLEVTSLVKELGGKYVVSKATRDIQAKFLLRNGADEVVYPDRDIAERIAQRHSANHIFDYIELMDGYSICEIPTKAEWIGKTIRDVDIRAKYHVSVLGTKDGDRVQMLPMAEHVLESAEHLIVMGEKAALAKLLKKL
ncbi:MAG: potassium channel family protein [Lachnospiraceae bacterium]